MRITLKEHTSYLGDMVGKTWRTRVTREKTWVGRQWWMTASGGEKTLATPGELLTLLREIRIRSSFYMSSKNWELCSILWEIRKSPRIENGVSIFGNICTLFNTPSVKNKRFVRTSDSGSRTTLFNDLWTPDWSAQEGTMKVVGNKHEQIMISESRPESKQSSTWSYRTWRPPTKVWHYWH